jgi:tRNA modification GTPase
VDVAFSTADTIVAVATPPGRGGLGVVRLSGPDATAITQRLTHRPARFEARHATLAVVHSNTSALVDQTTADQSVDQVVVTWFAAPHSYTGEDVVEISGHGSPWLLQRIVDLACLEGARLAQPGEFTLRAYLNERLDLVQAEAVADLIHAVTPLQARVAMDQLEGTLTTAVREIEEQLFSLAAKLEASLDFPDEGFHFITRREVTADLDLLESALSRLVSDGRRGRVIREGRMVVIAGRPNVGKSSLFNALVGASRAIVTPMAGTTRDVLTEHVDILGVPVTLVDTAGLRESVDAIEEEGVRRAVQARAVAALTLLVFDASQPLGEDDRRLLEAVSGPRLVVGNKSDLSDAPLEWSGSRPGEVPQLVSAVTGAGLEALRATVVAAMAGGQVERDTPMVSNQRHVQQLERALVAVERARKNLGEGGTEELVLAELGEARDALEAVTGRRTADELLEHIFSRFCIGK